MLLYSFGIYLLQAAYWSAGFFNSKAKLFQQGRKDFWARLASVDKGGRWIWIHCASLGEFEQGRPVIEELRVQFPNHKILLTFFSPSGFEVRKNYGQADLVTYLPWDTPANARMLTTLFKLELAIFVKYEFWLNYLHALQAHHVPVLSISTILRPKQVFFAWYGTVFRNGLRSIRYFFAQNDETVILLKSINITNAKRVGDTRFDRVVEITRQAAAVPLADAFKNNEPVMVVGSCWKEDLEVLLPFINERKLKFIITPHEVSEGLLRWMEGSLQGKSVRYSLAADNGFLSEAQVLVVDQIGLLARLYRYGEWAYVGGAFGKGLHNILEAASYGIPVFFGNRNYTKFQEAKDLIQQGGAFAVSDFTSLKTEYQALNRVENYQLACAVNKAYVAGNQGATEKIVKFCQTLLTP